jgi:hypothetical protein
MAMMGCGVAEMALLRFVRFKMLAAPTTQLGWWSVTAAVCAPNKDYADCERAHHDQLPRRTFCK